jgi:hypothetical protein
LKVVNELELVTLKASGAVSSELQNEARCCLGMGRAAGLKNVAEKQ